MGAVINHQRLHDNQKATVQFRGGRRLDDDDVWFPLVRRMLELTSGANAVPGPPK
jgi:hypothetical protein